VKTAICLREGDKVFRLLWLSESKAGVYIGIFSDTVDVHQSYHTDGTRHTRIGATHVQRWKDVPLASYSGFKQLAHLGFSAPTAISQQSWPSHRSNSAWDSVETIGVSAFERDEHLAIDVWLGDQDSLDGMNQYLVRRSQSLPSLRDIITNTFKIANFPGLWITTAIQGRREAPTD
jgi:hypothetical protein